MKLHTGTANPAQAIYFDAEFKVRSVWATKMVKKLYPCDCTQKVKFYRGELRTCLNAPTIIVVPPVDTPFLLHMCY
jgi:hypothetical protein